MEPINDNTIIPVRLADLARWKQFGLQGGTHAEGQAMAASIDLIFDNWQMSQRLAENGAAAEPLPAVAAAHVNGTRQARRAAARKR